MSINEIDSFLGCGDGTIEQNKTYKQKKYGKKKAFIVDGTNQMFRFFFTIEQLYNKRYFGEENINALYGMMGRILKLLSLSPHYLYICWEGGKGLRHEIYPEYKEGRKERTKENNIKFQIGATHKILEMLGIKSVFVDKYEADDVVATLTKKIKEKENNDVDITIYSTDRDFHQLLDENVSQYTGGKNIVTLNSYKEKYGFNVNQFIEYRSLIGDKSDNIKGIDKIGEKRGMNIINEYGNCNDFLVNLDDAFEKKIISKSIFEYITQNIEEIISLLELNKKLIGFMEIDGLNPEYVQSTIKDYDFFEKYIIKELGFYSLGEDLKKAFR